MLFLKASSNLLGQLLKKLSKEEIPEEIMPEDPTGWMVQSAVAQFLLMSTVHIKYMCMFGYCFMAGNKVFSSISPSASPAFKFVSLVLGATGGGTLVPIFINAIPVALAQDAYIIAIGSSYLLHLYFPILREVLKISPIFKVCGIVLFETMRAFIVCLFTKVAGAKIAPSLFSFPVFGPIMCGAVGGCGAAFMPLNKGLEPMKSGLAPPMMSALVAAAGYHLFLNTSLSEGCEAAEEKAHFHVALFFILVGLTNAFGFEAKKAPSSTKKEA